MATEEEEDGLEQVVEMVDMTEIGVPRSGQQIGRRIAVRYAAPRPFEPHARHGTALDAI